LAETRTGAAKAEVGPWTREAFESVDRAAEPDWLARRRADAFDVWESTPLPTTRSEEWRYTDPRLLAWDRVQPVAAAEPDDSAVEAAHAALAGRSASGSVIQIDAGSARCMLDESLRAKGVILADLATAATEHGELIEKYLGTDAAPARVGKFAALNAAFWSGGVFLYVPRGVRVERPIRVVRTLTSAGSAVFPRTLIVADEASHVALVESFASPDFDDPVFSCGVVEIHAGPAADVQYVAMQQWGRGVRHMSTQRTIAGRDSNLDTLAVNLGGSVARVDLAASLEGSGARSDMLGLYFGERDQHFDHFTRQDHKVPYATSDLLYKGALDGKTHAVFRGLIKVVPRAQRTDAYLTNRNLLLSKQAQATSLPNLEIEADDVRCSHAATVGHLDDEELFYIMSRGVPRREAERLVVFGFFADVLARLPLPGVVAELRTAVEEKIG
jgi:Fe-S cluster assembly protein SufD